MKNELLEKKKELEMKIIETQNELSLITDKLNKEILKEEVEELNNITEQLNILFQHPLVEKYGEGSVVDASKIIYDAMIILDRASTELQEEIEAIEKEYESSMLEKK